LNSDAKPENKDMTRKEELTKAPTPDKLDRSMRDQSNKTGDGDMKPYPLTEEEATPNTPKSDEAPFEKQVEVPNDSISSSESSQDTNQNEGDVTSDHNKCDSHPRKR
jgi:hypothetical protein